MKRCIMTMLSLCACVSLVACQERAVNNVVSKPKSAQVDIQKLAEGTPQFVVETVPASAWKLVKPETLPIVDNNSGMGWDLRHKDLQSFDLSKSTSFSQVSFDTTTKWPQKLPKDFHPKTIIENGKNPGLGIRALHEQGITGAGVNIAIIDQGLLLDHEEYKGNIQMYETLHNYDESSSMHGPAVTSIAVGKTIGVAPDAKVYYIASSFWDNKEGKDGKFEYVDNLSYMAKGIERVLEINKSLPEKEKIHVISISRGFGDLNKEDEKMVYDAIEKAKEENVLVITTSMRTNYGVQLLGLNRSLTKDSDQVENYSLGSWIEPSYARNENAIYVPMDCRTFAGFTANDEYAYGAIGGLSWTCPWLAGMYALCLQVNPNLTPEDFLTYASDTSKEVIHESNELNTVTLPVVQPAALIEKVKTMK